MYRGILYTLGEGVAQWVVRMTCNRSVVCSNHIKDYREQETLPSLLSISRFQEQIRA